MPLPTMNIPDFAGLTHTVNLANSGRQAAADSSAVVLSNEDLAALAALNALFPTSLGTKTAANSLAVTLASDGPLTVATGTIADAAWASGNGTLVALLKTLATAALSTSPKPVILPGKYATVAASATNQALGAGAIGDYLSHVTIIPATTSPGAISIKDGAGSAITIFAGGASSVSNLVPFAVPLGLTSTAGGWTITTGTSVSAIAEGKF